jgi:hypothetical protein
MTIPIVAGIGTVLTAVRGGSALVVGGGVDVVSVLSTGRRSVVVTGIVDVVVASSRGVWECAVGVGEGVNVARGVVERKSAARARMETVLAMSEKMASRRESIWSSRRD